MKRLGERIRRKRENLHLRLNDLAGKIGISSSALSQIENAKAFPSILTLKNIADSLNTTVGELIGENETLLQQPLISDKQKKFVQKNKSGTKLFLLSHHDPHKQMETYLLEFVPNSDSNGIMTNHPGQEFCYLTEGKLAITLEDKTYDLEVGDSFYFNSNIMHNAKNIHNGVTRAIWVVTPPNI
ncbi:XRE family transcriptional regulator [uncultured Draconibacterium sp.]|uniref:helix-turn-helix domain-containing protein n=1 Tax=uncultured Draconibacterium sp. TaxID=1573823 RepID=UPI0025EA35AE|nr:XRE family transcriptional regulator [uncultured Draconibacterium sp.]